MKKLMTIALGLGLVLGLGSIGFAQEQPTKPAKKEKTTKAKPTKAPKTKSTSKM